MGLANYSDAEEGLAKAFGQAVNGKYEQPGVQYYIGAGLLLGTSGEPKSFRQTFEILWRRQALLDMEASGQDAMTDEIVDKAKNSLYTRTFRLVRGTNSPVVFLKDLAYFRGSHNAWQYLKSAEGDETAFALMMSGKADPTISNHKRILLETKTS